MSKRINNPVYFSIYKPYGYLCQFTGESTDQLLGDLHDFPRNVYSIGRLDKDSEGLLLLTNDNNFKASILSPAAKTGKMYWVQVEGEISDKAITELCNGTISISHNGKQHQVAPAKCKKIEAPKIDDRNPPIRVRSSIPTSWIELTITEGKNRQVRKMTAAVGYPTLRLVRYSVGKFTLENMSPGDVVKIEPFN
jgi:23S rRNA pseudouridine2457 synthase